METGTKPSSQIENTLLTPSPPAQLTEPSQVLAQEDTSDIVTVSIPSDDDKDKAVKRGSIKTTTVQEVNQDDDANVGEDFVMVAPDQCFEVEPHRASFFVQIEDYLGQQIARCDYYQGVFEKQNNITMANKFKTYSAVSAQHLELLRYCRKNNDPLPKYTFERFCLNCLPVNIEIKEKELQIIVKVSNLSGLSSSPTYIIAEFEFPHPRDETMTNYLTRWFHYVTIEPKKLLCCSGGESRQLDMVPSTDDVLFTDPEGKVTSYDRPLTFFVDKGKSRTLKRKFKPIKLTFYEKTNICACDKRLGCVLVKIDAINDDSTVIARLPIVNGRKQTAAIAEVRVKVKEPLVNKSIRAHEEKLLMLVCVT